MSSTYVKRTVNNLRRLITASGKSAREVAHAAGIDESTISKYLSGQRQPQIDVLEKIAKGLGADFQEFFKHVLFPFRNNSRDSRMYYLGTS